MSSLTKNLKRWWSAITGSCSPGRPAALLGPLCLAAGVLMISGCHDRDESEIDGDSDGIPVTITVNYSHGVFDVLARSGAYTPVYVRRYHRVRDTEYLSNGYAVYSYHTVAEDFQPYTHAALLGGEEPGDESLWYWYLREGTQYTTVRIRPGHRVVLTLRAWGGNRGESMVGTITPPAAANQHITIALDPHDGVQISGFGVAGTTPPPPPPPGVPPQGQAVPPPPSTQGAPPPPGQ